MAPGRILKFPKSFQGASHRPADPQKDGILPNTYRNKEGALEAPTSLKPFLALFALMAATNPPLMAAQAPTDVVVLAVSAAESFDPKLETLKFADRDTARMVEIMTNVGRVPPDRVIQVQGAETNDVIKALGQANAIMQECRNCASKFVFYYSGHADEDGLMLADARLSRLQLHEYLGNVQSETKIVILDSCFSGALVRKGVKASPVFELPKAQFDQPSGSIFISASSNREYSYESRSLQGSVFTHHLVAGLNGMADVSGDGVVTVDEIYQYVYRETKLHSLLFPQSLKQTPEFVSRLEGRGAVALTYPAETNSRLILESDLGGLVTIASLNGIQYFRVDKVAGKRKALQLPPGGYSVTVNQGHAVGKGDVSLKPQDLASLTSDTLNWQSRIATTAKGRTPWSVQTIVGGQGGYVANQNPGPFAAARVSHSTFPKQLVDTNFGFHTSQNTASEANDWASTVRFGSSVGAEWLRQIPKAGNLGLGLNAGVTRQVQTWRYTNREDRIYSTTSPEASVHASLGWRLTGRGSIGMLLERRYLFVKDQRTGSRALAANGLGLYWRF